jgi:hypothetical protein
LKGDRVGLAKPRIGREIDFGLIDPGQAFRQLVFAEFLARLWVV